MDHPAFRLAVCGWSEESRLALEALESTGAFRAVGIGDPSGSALVRARRESGLPCHQQVGEWIRHGEFDAVLMGAGMPAAYAASAAARGLALLVLAEEASAADLQEAARHASMHGVPLVALRPGRHDAGLADLAGLTGGGAPAYLDIVVEAPADPARLLTAGLGHLVSLAGHLDARVSGSSWGDTPRALAATLQFGQFGQSSGSLAVVRVRHAPDAYVRISGDAPAGAFDLRIEDGNGYLAMSGIGGDRLRYQVDPVDHWTAEAARAASILASASVEDDRNGDREEAASLGALLDATARAIASGETQQTECCRRPALRLIGGTGQTHERAGNLHLVVS